MRHTLTLPILLLALLLGGCASWAESAEKTHAVSFTTVDTFLEIEHERRDLMRREYPEIHAFAENLRREAKPLFLRSWALIQIYKQTRDAGDREAAEASIEAVAKMAGEARKYLEPLLEAD